MASLSTDRKLSWLCDAITGRYVRLIEYLLSVWRFYGHSTYRRIDLGLIANYLWENPYTVSRRFAMQRGESDVNTYGETPVTTMQEIVTHCGIDKDDVVYELGCGRGRACFWLRCFIKCRVVGIDINPHFIWKAQRLRRKAHLEGVDFRCEDFFDSQLAGATVVYLYGTTLEDDCVKKIAEKLAQLPKGTSIITVSYPLSDFSSKKLFEDIDAFELRYTWGKTWVFHQKVL